MKINFLKLTFNAIIVEIIILLSLNAFVDANAKSNNLNYILDQCLDSKSDIEICINKFKNQ